ncbi:hypothetical protein ACIGEO_02880 [Stenotrophomonas bentonitica]|uniref:hypothetical protein n=1 Tax=Stenotrophomonas bentonitica TaxID=1450134 RepID=UPI0037D365FF
MSAPVDAMAVLRYNAKEATKKWGPDNQDAATLAAFAELIEAVSDGVEVAGYSEHGNAMIFTMERASRLRAAIARVKGGAA